ncbi:hypothetical protein HDU98_009036, partial [Podochytrium sp. JEL0797]
MMDSATSCQTTHQRLTVQNLCHKVPQIRIPPVLKRLLEHPRVKVAGSYIHNEVNHLKDDWGVVIPVQRSVALSRLAKEKGAVSDARKG